MTCPPDFANRLVNIQARKKSAKRTLLQLTKIESELIVEAVECSGCNAGVGQSCTNKPAVHAERHRAAIKLAISQAVGRRPTEEYSS